MKLAAAALLVLAQASAGAQADSWEWVGSGADGAQYFVRASVLEAVGPNEMVFWVRADLSKVQSTRNRSSMTRYSVDCARQTFRVLARATYGPDGSETSSYLPAYTSEQAMVPDTMIVVFARSVCVNFTPP